MNETRPEDIEKEFFDSLISSDIVALQKVIGEDLVLIDVMTGTEVTGQQLAEVLKSRNLKFDAIDRIGFRVRSYSGVAIITGQTVMVGAYEGQPFKIHSAYTHVFIKDSDRWRMVSAQGTPINSSSS